MMITRRKLRRLVLTEMDMMTTGNIIVGIAAAFVTLGPVVLHKLMDAYFQGRFTSEELAQLRRTANSNPDEAEALMAQILGDSIDHGHDSRGDSFNQYDTSKFDDEDYDFLPHSGLDFTDDDTSDYDFDLELDDEDDSDF